MVNKKRIGKKKMANGLSFSSVNDYSPNTGITIDSNGNFSISFYHYAFAGLADPQKETYTVVSSFKVPKKKMLIKRFQQNMMIECSFESNSVANKSLQFNGHYNGFPVPQMEQYNVLGFSQNDFTLNETDETIANKMQEFNSKCQQVFAVDMQTFLMKNNKDLNIYIENNSLNLYLKFLSHVKFDTDYTKLKNLYEQIPAPKTGYDITDIYITSITNNFYISGKFI